MTKALEKAQERFIGYISSVCDDFGLNRFVAQLYGILYFSSKPLSLDELAERLGASKGNVSINIRELEKWGAVRRVWVKGSRKDYYEPELDIKKVLLNKIASSAAKRIAEVSSMLDEVKRVIADANGGLSKEEKETAKIYRERIKRIEGLKDLAAKAMGLAAKIL